MKSHPKHNPTHLLLAGLLLVLAFGIGVVVGYYGRENEVQALKSQIDQAKQGSGTDNSAEDLSQVLGGVQLRARDTERQTDINSIATQLEVYFNDHGGYPVLKGQLGSDSWAESNLKGIDVYAMRPPAASSNAMTATASPTVSQYGYQTFASDGATACSKAPCAKFRLYWYSESSKTVQAKDSLN